MSASLGRWDDRPRGGHWPDEPPHGLMMRLATRHRNLSAARFADGFGIEVTDVAGCMGVLASYEHADEYPEQIACLRSWVPEPFTEEGLPGIWRRFGCQEIGPGDWTVATRRFCPACLTEAPYHRAWFDLSFMSTCPDHGLRLIDTTEDGTAVGFATATIDVTSTGERLARTAPRLGKRRRSLEAFALSRFGLGEPWTEGLFDGMRLGEVVAACGIVGDAVLGGHRELRPTPGDLGREAGRVLSAGFEVIDGGCDAVVAAFKEVGRAAPAGTYGARKLFGWIYDAFAPLAGTHGVRDLLMDAAHELGRAGTRHSDRRRGEAEYVTLTRIAEKHGLRRKTLRNVAGGLGCLHGNEAQRTPLLVAAAEVPALVAAFDWGLLRGAAADALGIGADAMDDLVRGGHVRSTWRGVDGDRIDRFHFGDLQAFVESLPFERLPEDDPVFRSNPPPVPLSSVLDRLRRTDTDIVAEVLAGRITLLTKVAAPDNLREFLVASDAAILRHPTLTPLLVPWKTRVSRAPETAMTKREACASLGVTPETIAALLDKGHLAMIEGKDTGNRAALDRGSVRDFADKYLAAKFYADAIGQKTQFVTAKAERAGIVDLLHDLRRRQARSPISVVYERATMTGFLGLATDPDKARPGHLAWTRIGTHLGRGKSGFLVWSIDGEREAVCAMRKLRWRVRLQVGERSHGGSCIVTASLTLGRRDGVDPGRVAAIAAKRDRPDGLTFGHDRRVDEIQATLLSDVGTWAADAAGVEAAPGEDDAFRLLSDMLMTLRTFFDDPAAASDKDREAA